MVPQVEAPEGSGCECWVLESGVEFGLVPEVGNDWGCLWQVNHLSLGLVEMLEVVQAQQELLEELCWLE